MLFRSSVSSSYSALPDNAWEFKYDDYLDEEREEVREAIYEAMGGWPDWLAVLIAESVYPEDPDMAEHFIDKRKLTQYSILSDHLKTLNTYDAGTVLASLFDSVYREHA